MTPTKIELAPGIYLTFDETAKVVDLMKIKAGMFALTKAAEKPKVEHKRRKHRRANASKRWTIEEDSFMTINWQNKPASWIAKQLGRTSASVYMHARKMGLKRNV